MYDSFANTLEDMRLTIDSATARLHSVSEAESESRREAGKWSKKEILGHLIDSAANNHIRFVAAQSKDDLIFAGYDQEASVACQNYQASQWPGLITLWESYNRHLFHLVSSIPDEKLQKLCTRHSLHLIAWQLVKEDEPTTLEYLIADYVAHMKHHLRQIFGD